MTFTASASDPDIPAGNLSFSLGADAPEGASIDASSGEFSWTPTESDGPGTFNIEIQVSDGELTDTTSFEVTVGEVDSAPIIVAVEDQFVEEGDTLTFTINANDVDEPAGDISFALGADAPDGAAIDSASGVFTWTPTESQDGDFSVTVLATDDTGLSDSTIVNITVGESNQPPVLLAIDDQTVEQGSELTLVASATDQDLPANELSFSLGVGAPDGAAIDSSSGEFTWTPTVSTEPGIFTITVIVDDNNGGTASESFDVTVTPAVDTIFLAEEDRFETTATREITVGPDTQTFSFQYEASFDGAGDSINDAFEVALLDENGDPLVLTFDGDRDAYFNLTEGEAEAESANAVVDGNRVRLDLSHIADGTVATVVFRLINTDSDSGTIVEITDIETTGDVLGTPVGVEVSASPTAFDTSLFGEFGELTDVTGSFETDFGSTSFNAQDDVLFTNITLTNVGQVAVAGRLIAVIEGLSEEQVRLIQPDGRLSDGRFFVEVTSDSGQIAPGESARTQDLRLFNENNEQFDFELTLLAELNSGPSGFVSEPPTIVEAGNTLNYTAEASDPDADQSLVYSIVAGPEDATINPDTGELIWDTSIEDVGNQSITIRATDPFGQFVEQRFSVEVVDSVQNRPPVFTTSPVTEAIASSGFEVTTLATGENPVGVSVVDGFTGPRIVTANEGDQTIGIYEGENDRFDDATSVSTGFPVVDDELFDVGYAIDVGIPEGISSTFDSNVWGFVQADVNNDGILDFVNGIEFQDNAFETRNPFVQITVNLGDGEGGFGEAILVFERNGQTSTSNIDYRSLDIADLNNDGNIDLVFTDRARDGQLFSLLGDGEGGFADANVQQFLDADVTPLRISDFVVADIDGDGNQDLIGRTSVVAFGATFQSFLLSGNGDGTFADTLTILGDAGSVPTNGRDLESEPFDVADLDGDGDLDFAIATSNTDQVEFHFNDGSGNLELAGSFTLARPAIPTFFEIADFTGDGNLDIAYSLLATTTDIFLLVGDGSGLEFEQTIALEDSPALGNLSGTSTPIDIDGDGDLDLIVGDVSAFSSQIRLGILTNDGTGLFTATYYATPDFGGFNDRPQFANVGDYNNDGVIDLSYAVSDNLTNRQGGVGVRLGTRPGEFGATRTTTDLGTVFTSGLAVGDFNGDGNADYVDLTNRTTSLGRGDGSFEETIPSYNITRVAGFNVVADFNNDGFDDLVATTGEGGTGFFVALANGDGTFNTERTTAGGFFGYSYYLATDFNGDGFTDFVANATVDRVNDVYLNDPENPGTFSLSFQIQLGDEAQGINVSNWGESLSVGDFTGDGIVDILTPERESQSVFGDSVIRLQVWAGDGTGQFTLHSDAALFDDANLRSLFSASFYEPGDLVSGDIDNDGDIDAIANTILGQRIFLNDGTGNFEFSNHLEYQGFSQRGVDTWLTDLDDDGNLDLVLSARPNDPAAGRGPLRVVRGLGDGTFAAPVSLALSASVSSSDSGGFADFDGDGHLEFIHYAGNDLRIPSVSIYSLTRDGIVDQLAFDLDGDGNEEILVVNEQYDRLQIFQGDNLGGLTRLPDLQTGRAPQAVTVADLNGDGTVEILVANRASESITVYTGDLENGYTSTEVLVGGALIDIQAADVNGDGNVDVFALDVERGGLLKFISDGTTTLTSPIEVALGGTPQHLTLADANGNGSIDAVVTLPESNRVLILDDIAGDGVGDSVFLEFATSPSEVAVLELNDDGNPDIAVTLPDSDAVAVLYGRGNDQFSSQQLIDVGDRPESITVADADEDGRLDLLVANAGDNTASVIFNRFDPNEVYNYDADAIDPDNDTVSYRLIDGPGGLFINSQTGEVTWAASPNQVGVHTVTIEASDGRGGIATQTYQIEVEPARDNASPLIATEPVATIGAGESFEYDVAAVDADNDALRYRILSGPEGATIDPVTGLLQWDGRVDGAAFISPQGATINRGEIVTPVGQNSSLASNSLTVEGWFNPQELTASNGAASFFRYDNQNDPFHLYVFGNSELRLDLDQEGTTNVARFTAPLDYETDRWYHFALSVDDANQTFEVLVDGTSVISGDLPTSFIYDDTTQLEIGNSFQFSGLVDNFRVWNVARSADQIREGLSQQFDGDPNLVLDYRFEDEGGRLVLDNTANRNDGYLVSNAGVPAIVPDGLAEAGIHSFVIGVEDGRGGMTTQAFDIEIVPELRGTIEGNIFDDANGDGVRNDGSDPATPAENGLPDWLVFIDSNNNQFADPDEAQAITEADGNYSLQGLLPDTYPIRIASAAGFEAEGLRNVTVGASQTETVDVAAVQSPLGQIRGQLLTFDGQAIGLWEAFVDLNDDGARDEGEPIAISDRLGNFAVTGLAAGTYVLRANLPAGWIPEVGFDGVEVTLAADEISEGNDLVVVPANTSVTGGVHFVTTAPQTVQAREVFRYASVATNINGDAIAYEISVAPEGLTIDPQNGLVAWQPSVGQVGEHQVILLATDASGSVSLQSFNIEVTPPNSAPVITSVAPVVGFTDATFVYQVVAQDGERDSLSYSLADAPAGATVDATGRIQWQPGTVGNANFEVIVSDTDGNDVRQIFSVEVFANAPDATPFVVDQPRSEIGLGQNYLSSITGEDGLGRPLTWTLIDGPVDFEVTTDGILSWTPTAIGLQTLVLRGTSVDGETEDVTFNVNVVGRPVTNTPAITSDPILSATIDNQYQYDLEVDDPTGNLLTFLIVEGPTGASIDPSNGTLRWAPATDQLGESDFVIEVINVDGQSTTQEFTVSVTRFGGPPLIVSTPPTEVNVGGSFLYSVDAVDIEGDPINYRLLEAPNGLTIVETTGEIFWTPSADQIGEQVVAIEVTDGFGNASTQVFAVLVGDGIVNLAPVISSEAPRFTAVGSNYAYQIDATDPEGSDLIFEIGQGPTGLSVSDTGLVTWTPAAGQEGQFVVTLQVTDAGGATAIESFELDVLAENRAPVIISTPPSELVQGVELRYDVLVSDADLDPLAFELVNGPEGATINAFGQIVWETGGAALGQFDFEVNVSDPRGGDATQSFTIDLIADTEGPLVSLVENLGDGARNILPWNGPFVVTARAIDNVGVASLTLSANGQDIPLSANGQAEFSFEDWGFARIVATATAVDTSGNVTTQTIEFDYDFPDGFSGLPGQTLPTAIITSPGPAEAVAGFVTVIGTANAEEFAAYELQFRRADEPESAFQTILRSETAVVDGELGQIDTTLLRNDEYVIRLAVADADGVVNITEQNIGLTGDLKLGNFQLQFTDLVIPVAGISIDITRVYDSLDADIEGEFGFGWQLQFRDTDLRIGLPESGLEDIGIYSAFRPGTRVFLNIPGEGRVGFTFTPQIEGLPGGVIVARPRFTPDPGVTSTLSPGVSGFLLVNEFGELVSSGNVPYNPASPDFGGAFVVTTAEGVTYRIDGATGKLDSATDANGVVVEFSDGGIESSDGVSVTFERDAQNRIAAIVDGEGNRFEYAYGSNGSLATVTDPNGNVTELVYDDANPRFLTEVIDPLGNTGIRGEYNDEGRLISVTGPDGNELGLETLVGERAQTLSDPLGNETTQQFDDFGNVVSQTDALGFSITNTFDSQSNLTSTTDEVGRTTNYTYDAFGNLLTLTEPGGGVIRYTYANAARGLVASITDAQGNTRRFEYDANGNVTKTIDPQGNESIAIYDGEGRLLQEESANGELTSYRYDEDGLLEGIDFDNGRSETYVYDEAGRLIEQVTTRIVNGESEDLTQAFEYDGNGNIVRFEDAFGAVTLSTFDANNRLLETTDALGRTTKFEYDSRGNLIGTLLPDTTPDDDSDNPRTSAQFDALGQLTQVTDERGNTTRLVYDATGQLVEQIFADDTPDDLTDNPRIRQEYDGAGQQTAIIDENGNRTEFEFNDLGNQIVTTDALGNQILGEFDFNGRATGLINELGVTTNYAYDNEGRIVGTLYSNETSDLIEYDSEGRPAIRTDRLGNETAFTYDSRGRITSVLDAEGGLIEFTYDDLDNILTQTDANGRTTEFFYDALGRRSSTRLPGGQTDLLEYDAVGNLISYTDFEGQQQSFEYDERDQLIRQSIPGDGVRTFTYFANGLLASETDSSGTTSYQYDERDRLISRTQPDDNQVLYQYDDVGNVVQTTTLAGSTSYEYDALNRIEAVTDSDGNRTEYSFDEASRLVETRFDNGLVERREYTPENFLQRVVTLDGTTIVLDFTYELDGSGQRAAVVDASGNRTEYEYDQVNRLITETNFTAGQTDPSESVSFVYDLAGNRLQSVSTSGGTTNYAYDENDRLLSAISDTSITTFEYDANGNRIAQTENGETTLYRFSSNNRLTGVDFLADGSFDVTYAYDVSGDLTARTENASTIFFQTDESRELSNIVVEYFADDSIDASYTYGQEILAQERDGESYFYHTDGLGSVRALSDDSTAFANRYTYANFGELSENTETVENRYLFDGQRRDESTGLDYLRARFYDSQQGVLISVDPFEGTPQRPDSIHDYVYAGNNPINASDPSGLFTLIEVNVVQSSLITIQRAYASSAQTGLKRAAGIADNLIAPGVQMQNLGISIGFSDRSDRDRGYDIYLAGTAYRSAGYSALRVAISGIYADTFLTLVTGAVDNFLKQTRSPEVNQLVSSYEKAQKLISQVGNQLGIGDAIPGTNKPTSTIDSLIEGYVKASEQSLRIEGLARYVNGLETNYQQGVDEAITLGDRLQGALNSLFFDN